MGCVYWVPCPDWMECCRSLKKGTTECNGCVCGGTETPAAAVHWDDLSFSIVPEFVLIPREVLFVQGKITLCNFCGSSVWWEMKKKLSIDWENFILKVFNLKCPANREIVRTNCYVIPRVRRSAVLMLEQLFSASQFMSRKLRTWSYFVRWMLKAAFACILIIYVNGMLAWCSNLKWASNLKLPILCNRW